jgi:hypothetical protein
MRVAFGAGQHGFKSIFYRNEASRSSVIDETTWRLWLDQPPISNRQGCCTTSQNSGTLLSRDWRITRSSNETNCVCIEKQVPHRYGHRPSDDLLKVISEVRSALWASILVVPPYAKYYLYISPPAKRRQVLPQLLSIYVVMFFLGSITRYRPQHFEALLDTSYGPQIEGFLTEAPSQFLYLLASEFLKQEVSKPATV